MSSMVTYSRPWNRTANPVRETAIEQSAILRSMTRHQVAVTRTPAPAPRPQSTPVAPVDPTAARIAQLAAKVRPNRDGSTPTVPYAVLNDMLTAIGEGYFGLDRREASSAGNVTTFFRIKAMHKGGPLRIVQVLGGPGSWRYISLGVKAQFHALRHIGADVEAAGLRFAEKTSCCRRCHSPLSATVSTNRGYGPDCITKI